MPRKKAPDQASPPKGGKRPPLKKAKSPEVAAERPFLIVGIGASAGGFEALSELFMALPPDTGMAFVVVQHLDPKHESLLPELIAKMTRMPVQQVQDGMQVKPNHVYVIPPNTLMTIVDATLKLAARPQVRQPFMSIDHFFRSLGEVQKASGIGIILSGSSSDGALGIEVIKHGGGITFAQEESSARFAYMPKSAIATGCVDFELTPQEIAGELVRLARHPYLWRYQASRIPPPPVEEKSLAKILTLLKRSSGVDFTYYRQSTIKRRIFRRMALHKTEKLEDYVDFLQSTPTEGEALYQDVLIKVTGFFRDPEAFEVLRTQIFPEFNGGRLSEPARVWVPGCSSGEEAYSLAICWQEFLAQTDSKAQLTIFATDVSEEVIARARSGLYLENIAADVSPERLQRFFTKVDNKFQVTKAVRDMCVFAKQNLITDPPFSKLDLISCRNVLIYLEPVLQKKIIPMFHFALKPGGFLMLGSSETVGQFSDLFHLTNKKYRIYRKRLVSLAARPPVDFLGVYHAEREEAPETQDRPPLPWSRLDLYREADRMLLKRFAPAAVVVNEHMDILQFRGDTDRYLKTPPGEASFNILHMARRGLLVDLHRVVDQAFKSGGVAQKTNIYFEYNGKPLKVNLEVIPLPPGPGAERLFLVLFEEAGALAPPPEPLPAPGEEVSPEQREVAYLKQELAAATEQLQTMIEDHESAIEELRATNEELLTANEEFQSLYEELETAKEELQSANEELTTLNEELQVRNVELYQTNNDLHNLLTCTDIPVVMLGQSLEIRRLTPAAMEVLNLLPVDMGRPISDIRLKVDLPHLEQWAREVIETLKIKTAEVQDQEGRWFSLYLRPYKTMDNVIGGAVLTLMDITKLKQGLIQLKESRDFAQAIIQTMREPLVVLNRNLKVKMANQAFFWTFQVKGWETEGHLIYELGNRQWDIPALRDLLETILAKDTHVEDFMVTHEFPDIGWRTMLLNAGRITPPEGAGEDLILLTIEDITARRQAEMAVQEGERKLRSLSSQLLSSQERERRRVSLQLRDELGPALESLKSRVQALAHKTPEQKERRREDRDLLKNLDDIMDEVRNLSRELSPPVLEELGVSASLKYLAHEFSGRYNIRTALDIDELDAQISREGKIILYRILQEALSNVARHSQASRLKVAIRRQDDSLYFLVEDNGKGFNVEEFRAFKAADKGLGLQAIQERVELLGGALKIESQEGKGTRLSFTAPWEKLG